MSRGATEDMVAKLPVYESSDLPERTKAALALADVLSGPRPFVDPELHQRLRHSFDDDQILDLGMCVGFVTGWQRFIEAFGIQPDSWDQGSVMPWDRILEEPEETGGNPPSGSPPPS